jgi:hypothetical protein
VSVLPTTVESWDFPDPAGRPLEEVRAIRDEIERRVRELCEAKIEAIRTDPTAHRVWLMQLLPRLADEFEGVRRPEEIRACADAILSRYDDRPIKSFALVLAERQARECLRRETCDALVGA